MLYEEKPDLKDLPTPAQLFRASVIAVLTAIVLTVGVVLPAEYAIDPTGIGRVLGLTEMGEIKQELHDEAEDDHDSDHSTNDKSSLIGRFFALLVSSAHAQDKGAWMDEVEFTLQPGDTYEVKMTMGKGDVAEYQMLVTGGRVNFDLHGHGDGESATYEKGRGSTGSEGDFTAAFPGSHGWFWRNRDKKPLTVTLRLRGAYSELRHGQ